MGASMHKPATLQIYDFMLFGASALHENPLTL
jgi:hypothetical protein